MPRKPTPAHVVHAIKLAAEKFPGTSAAQIGRTLAGEISDEEMPKPRTIERIVKEARTADTSGAWDPAASKFDTEATRHLLDVIAIVATTTGGQIGRLTEAEAEALTSIRMSDYNQEQNIPLWQAYRLAREYVRRDGGAGDLDLLLALRPWTSEVRFKVFGEALQAGGWLPRDYTEETANEQVRWLFADRFSADLGPELRQTFGSALAFNIEIKLAVERDKQNQEEEAE